MVKKSSITIKRLQRELAGNAPALKVLQTQALEVTDLGAHRLIINVLCNPALRPMHWTQIQAIIKSAASHSELTLGQLKRLDIGDSLDQLAEISERAKREARLEAMLNKMEQEWQTQVLLLIPFRDADILVLQGNNVEEIQARLDEHRLLAQTIRSSPDVGPL